MSDIQVSGSLSFTDKKYKVKLSIIEFMEEKIHILYSPALDLSGYGKTPQEAKSSFSETLNEFFRYTHNKQSLEEVLKELGWSINGSKNKQKYSPPKDSDLVSSNQLYNEIVNNKNYSVYKENVELVH